MKTKADRAFETSMTNNGGGKDSCFSIQIGIKKETALYEGFSNFGYQHMFSSKQRGIKKDLKDESLKI